MLSRRGFVVAGGSIALVAGSGASAAVVAGLQSSIGSSPAFSRAQFAKLINTRFTGRLDSGDYSFQLVGIEDGPESPGVEQFRLRFTASSTDLPDGSYQVAHEIDGQLHQQILHIEAAAEEQPADVYYASFSLLA